MNTIYQPALDLSHWVAQVAHLWRPLPTARARTSRDFDAADVLVDKGRVHSLTGFEGGLIECVQGCVWLTHDGDCRDVVLEASQMHVVDRDSRLTIFALASAVIRLVDRP